MAKKKKLPTDVYWRCYPAYIDAYECTDSLPEEYRRETGMTKAIEDLHKAMKSNAHSWGVASIGEQVLRNGAPLEVFGGKVFQIGYVWYRGKTGKEVTKKYALILRKPIVDGYYWDNWEIVEFNYPDEWNVT